MLNGRRIWATVEKALLCDLCVNYAGNELWPAWLSWHPGLVSLMAFLDTHNHLNNLMFLRSCDSANPFSYLIWIPVKVDCSVYILNVRRQFDLPVPDRVFWRTFQNPAIRNALMKLPLLWSPRAKEPHLRVPDSNQDRGEQTAQQELSPAASLMWDRLLWASSWRKMESQKPWELLSDC